MRAGGVSDNLFEVTPTILSENFPLENRTSNMFIIDLYSEKEYMFLSESYLIGWFSTLSPISTISVCFNLT